MNEFTASNGARVVKDFESGTWYTVQVSTVDNKVDLAGVHVDALREFFQAERDETLGRWRTSDHPDYVAYGRPDGYVTILREVDASRESFLRQDVENPTTFIPLMVARAYFDAHPEPKPWHDAQHNEVWELTTPAMGARVYQVVRNEVSGFRFFLITDEEGFRPGLFPDEVQITSGRKVWPVES